MFSRWIALYGVSRGTSTSVPSLLERDVRRALDERARRALADRADRPHRAGTDHHPAVTRRAGCRRRAAIAVVEQSDERIPRRCADRARRSPHHADVSLRLQQAQPVRRKR